ncbi:hypothetical protein, conserved [Eimeria praecox]|uniref:tRNA-uridine aminocarboxypropyltransferase n=1 Tax=Eimeria praecox TaxID=51316 RepID=U6G5U0_9EIME|nr:hypothetical protein, conserved [Eimeria praecox]
MPPVDAAGQQATGTSECSFPSAACEARHAAGEAEAEKEEGEVSKDSSPAAAFIGDSMQQQGRRLGHHQQQQRQNEQWQQKQHERKEQQQKREHSEYEKTGQGQEGEDQNQQPKSQNSKRRRVCSGCNRPCSVCYCSIIQGRDLSLSDPDVSSVVNRVLIFMHPLEKKRKNGSVRVLQKLVKGIEIWPHRRPGCCPFAAEQQQQPQQQEGEEKQHEMHGNEVLQEQEGPSPASSAVSRSEGLKASIVDCEVEGAAERSQQQQKQQQHAELQRQPQPEQQGQQDQQHLCTRDGVAVCDTTRMVLLFPTEASLALGVGSLPVRLPVTLLAIDGTWKEAKEMFSASPWLQQLPAVHLPMQSMDPVHHASAASAAGTVIANADADDAASCGSSRRTDSAAPCSVWTPYTMPVLLQLRGLLLPMRMLMMLHPVAVAGGRIVQRRSASLGPTG